MSAIVNFEFQAILCKLDSIRKGTRNTEILKALMNDCLNFNMKVIKIEKCYIGALDETSNKNLNLINQYSIELYSDNELLNNKFEREQKLNKQEEEKSTDFEWKVGATYNCKSAFLVITSHTKCFYFFIL